MKDIQRVYISHTLNSVALSIIGVYIPAYLLTLHYSLAEVIYYFAVSHVSGLMICFLLYIPLMKHGGLIKLFKLNYPLQILQLFLLFWLQYNKFPLEIAAIAYGAANYAYWIPLNLLFVRHSEHKDMGSNLAKFYALPQLFGIVGPLIGALLIPFMGFWPVFVLTAVGLVFSYLPLNKINHDNFTINLNFSKAVKRISRNKSLFLFEAFDNILEESEWFWAIYVFLIIGSLQTPGIVGSLTAIGGAFFTFAVGKFANKHDKKIIPIAAVFLLGIYVFRIFVADALPAYVLTIIASFIFTLFLVSYFSTIYRTIKNDDEEEFILLREIPTVLGRLVVFGAIFLTIHNLQYFFVAPIIFILLLLGLYYWKQKALYENN
jgi:hypothetical protein